MNFALSLIMGKGVKQCRVLLVEEALPTYIM